MRETVSVSTAEAFATTKNPPHAIRLALGSVDTDVLAQSLDKVKRVIDACVGGHGKLPSDGHVSARWRS